MRGDSVEFAGTAQPGEAQSGVGVKPVSNLIGGAESMRGLDEYAAACRRVGQRVFMRRGTWWREVRPCFFRPILPFLPGRGGAEVLPARTIFGGCQYPAYEGGTPPNSFMTYLAYADARDYSIRRLAPRLQRYVRSAERRFLITPLLDVDECKARAYSVYLEFHERTHYGYMAHRVHRPRFDRWVEAEFADPGLVALGAWDGGSLAAVSLSRIVGDAWVYSTFFASSGAVHGHVANLMLHHVRSLASAAGDVAFVFAGMQKLSRDDASIDEFHLRRGAVFVRRPAVLQLNPVARVLLRRLRPGLLTQLAGAPELRAQSSGAAREHDGGAA